MIIKKVIALILFFSLAFSVQAFAKDYIGRTLNGSGSGKVVKNQKGKVVGLKCPQSLTNNTVVNFNCGLSKSPGPLLVIKHRGSTIITRYCMGIPCGNLKKGMRGSRVSKRGKKSLISQKESVSTSIDQQKKSSALSKNLNKKKASIILTFSKENYQNGKLKRTIIARNNKIQDLTLYYQSGVKKYRRLIHGNIVSATHYYQSGKIQESYQFQVYPAVFYEKDIISKQDKKVELVNISREYYPVGRLYRETTWKNNHRVRVRVFDKNGKNVKS